MIKYYCDGCNKELNREGLNVLTLHCLASDKKSTKHYCSKCDLKIKKLLKGFNGSIEEQPKFTEAPTVSLKQEDKSSPEVVEVCQKITKAANKAAELEDKIFEQGMGIDSHKVIALYKAGWQKKDIIGEIDLKKEEVILDIIDYYETYEMVPETAKSPEQIEKRKGTGTPLQKDTAEESVNEFISKMVQETPIPNTNEEVAKEKSTGTLTGRCIPTSLIDEFLFHMRNSRTVTNEIRKRIITEYCQTDKSTTIIARDYGVSQPSVISLTNAYKKVCIDRGLIKEDSEELPDSSKAAEYISTLREDKRLPKSKRLAALKEICAGRHVSKVSKEYDITHSVLSNLLKGYREYLKEMSN